MNDASFREEQNLVVELDFVEHAQGFQLSYPDFELLSAHDYLRYEGLEVATK